MIAVLVFVIGVTLGAWLGYRAGFDYCREQVHHALADARRLTPSSVELEAFIDGWIAEWDRQGRRATIAPSRELEALIDLIAAQKAGSR